MTPGDLMHFNWPRLLRNKPRYRVYQKPYHTTVYKYEDVCNRKTRKILHFRWDQICWRIIVQPGRHVKRDIIKSTNELLSKVCKMYSIYITNDVWTIINVYYIATVKSQAKSCDPKTKITVLNIIWVTNCIYYIIHTYLKSMTIYNMYNRPDMGWEPVWYGL